MEEYFKWDYRIDTSTRRNIYLKSFPNKMNKKTKYLKAINELDKFILSCNDKDKITKAKRDSNYYFKELMKLSNIGK